MFNSPIASIWKVKKKWPFPSIQPNHDTDIFNEGMDQYKFKIHVSNQPTSSFIDNEAQFSIYNYFWDQLTYYSCITSDYPF